MIGGLFGIGAHGGYAALTTFLPTYLREVRQLSVLGDRPRTQFEATQVYARNRWFLDTLIVDPSERAQVLASPYQLFRF